MKQNVFIILVSNINQYFFIIVFITLRSLITESSTVRENYAAEIDLKNWPEEQKIYHQTTSKTLKELWWPQMNETLILPSDFRRMSEEFIEKSIVRTAPLGTYGPSKPLKDCLMLCTNTSCSRGFTRKNPQSECYKLKPNTQQNSFWSVWNDIRQDFSYTFDFVLWDEMYQKENQFWYLILFLKSLIGNIENPFDIVSIKQVEELNGVHNTIKELLKEYNKYESIANSTKLMMKELNENMTNFKNAKIALLNVMNKFIKNADTYSNNSDLLRERMKGVDEDMFAIKNTIDHLAESIHDSVPTYIEEKKPNLDENSIENNISSIEYKKLGKSKKSTLEKGFDLMASLFGLHPR